jgi:hypothetical protein
VTIFVPHPLTFDTLSQNPPSLTILIDELFWFISTRLVDTRLIDSVDGGDGVWQLVEIVIDSEFDEKNKKEKRAWFFTTM